MEWLLLLIGCIYFVEVFIRLDALSHVQSLKEIVGRVVRVVRSSRISDHWKEKALPRYSLALFKKSLQLFAILLTSFIIFPALGLLSEFFNGDFIALSTSLPGLAASTCFAIIYATLRSTASKSTEGYSYSAKILHYISLGTPFIGEALFDLEKALFASKAPDVSADRHVFVCGLARAGTTIIMRRLYESDQFCSLTYRDMPFVLAPNLWHRINKRSWNSREMQERAHGDGLMVNYDSPEALEEVFWNTHCGSEYIKSDFLVPMSASEEVLQDFRTYISLVLKGSGGKRYLSKNNNNILRLHSINKAFPDATIIIPFRQPVQQAYSLLRQHQRFTQLHKTDQFAGKYMSWLVHHEFGADHRPFQFRDSNVSPKDPMELEYWLHVWVNTYMYIRDHLPSQSLLVCYDTLCSEGEIIWRELAERVNVLPDTVELTLSGVSREINHSLPVELVDQANELYDDLCANAVGGTYKRVHSNNEPLQ